MGRTVGRGDTENNEGAVMIEPAGQAHGLTARTQSDGRVAFCAPNAFVLETSDPDGRRTRHFSSLVEGQWQTEPLVSPSVYGVAEQRDCWQCGRPCRFGDSAHDYDSLQHRDMVWDVILLGAVTCVPCLERNGIDIDDSILLPFVQWRQANGAHGRYGRGSRRMPHAWAIAEIESSVAVSGPPQGWSVVRVVPDNTGKRAYWLLRHDRNLDASTVTTRSES